MDRDNHKLININQRLSLPAHHYKVIHKYIHTVAVGTKTLMDQCVWQLLLTYLTFKPR